MINAKDKAELDQAMEMLINESIPMFYRMYRKCVSEGFTGIQAMEIVLAVITKPS